MRFRQEYRFIGGKDQYFKKRFSGSRITANEAAVSSQQTGGI